MKSSFNSWYAFFSMGGYAFYVWGAYGSLILSFALGAWWPWRQRQQLLQKLADEPAA